MVAYILQNIALVKESSNFEIVDKKGTEHRPDLTLTKESLTHVFHQWTLGIPEAWPKQGCRLAMSA